MSNRIDILSENGLLPFMRMSAGTWSIFWRVGCTRRDIRALGSWGSVGVVHPGSGLPKTVGGWVI
jgi:hypothetical protein